MFYSSTRGDRDRKTAAAAIIRGIAEDGGLFVPCDIPALTEDELESLIPKSYRERAGAILAPFLTDFTPDEIAHCVDCAYTEAKFGSSAVAPVRPIGGNTQVLELFHGPTAAFKDMALQILPYLMTLSAQKCGGGETIRILVATSGDTGKAALEGFADVAGTEVMVFYPSDGVSDIQKLQMMTQTGANVGVCGIRGNFDDAQTGVKQIFADADIARRLAEQHIALSSANSINVGRLLPQIVYYISAYCDLRRSGAIRKGEPILVAVPTGNFGNILAASYAREMGLPIAKLICASNQNNVLTDFLRTGVYDRNRPFYTTESPSMDILISSNLERLLHRIGGEDTTRKLMASLKETGRYAVGDEMRRTLSAYFWGGCCDFAGTRACIADTFAQSGYLLDPHTAVAVSVLADYRRETGDERTAIVAATASPYKFAQSVLGALGEEADGFEAIARLYEKTGSSVPGPIAALREKPVLHDAVCEIGEMPRVVLAGCPVRRERA